MGTETITLPILSYYRGGYRIWGSGVGGWEGRGRVGLTVFSPLYEVLGPDPLDASVEPSLLSLDIGKEGVWVTVNY